MSAHLTSEQICKVLANDAGLDVRDHLEGCKACREEVDHLRETLKAFRRSVHDYGEQQFNPQAFLQNRPRRSYSLAIASQRLWTAVAIVLLGALLGWNLHRPQRKEIRVQTANSDAALLKQLDQQMSQTVPAAMEPLVQLVSWDGETQVDGVATGKAPAPASN
jgi:anti-sigma factor RsiW